MFLFLYVIILYVKIYNQLSQKVCNCKFQNDAYKVKTLLEIKFKKEFYKKVCNYSYQSY